MHRCMRIENDLMGHRFVINPADALEHMTERPMPQVVKQRPGQADDDVLFLHLKRQLPQPKQNPLGGLHDAQAVAVTRMIRAGICQRRHPQVDESGESARNSVGVSERKEEAIHRPFQTERR